MEHGPASLQDQVIKQEPEPLDHRVLADGAEAIFSYINTNSLKLWVTSLVVDLIFFNIKCFLLSSHRAADPPSSHLALNYEHGCE